MPISQIISQPCTLLLVSQASTTTNEYGDEVPGTPPEVETFCSLQQVTRDEPEDQGELSETTWRIFFPAGTVITTQDRVTVGGTTYELTGGAWDVEDPWAGNLLSHVEASVKLTS